MAQRQKAGFIIGASAIIIVVLATALEFTISNSVSTYARLNSHRTATAVANSVTATSLASERQTATALFDQATATASAVAIQQTATAKEPYAVTIPGTCGNDPNASQD